MLAPLFALSVAAPTGAGAESTPTVELLYVDANEGSSSGGHVALRLADEVFHFHVERELRTREALPVEHRELLVLGRLPWDAFAVRYSALQNRTLHGAELDLEPSDVARLRSHWNRLLAVQGRELAMLDAVVLERRALEARGPDGDGVVDLRGAGLFAPPDPAAPRPPGAARLRVAAGAALGAGGLPEARSRAAVALASLPAVSTPRAFEGLARDRYPREPELVGERLRDALQWREALAVLDEARPVRRAVLLDPFGDEGRALSPGERRWLSARAAELEASVRRLLVSRRPDRGGALLVAVARHRAVSLALAEGRLWTLDPHPSRERSHSLPADGDASWRLAVRSLERAARRAHWRWRDGLVERADAASAANGERDLHRLELHAARHHDLRRGVVAREPVRVAPDRSLPSRAAPVPLPTWVGSQTEHASALDQARGNEARLIAALERATGYDLIDRNCVTELQAELQGAFGDRAAAARALGGAWDPQEGLSFIPFAFYDRAVARYRIADTRVIPSYRKRQVTAMREREPDWRVALREASTLGSTVYRGSSRDGHFLFFTDGAVWPRPLLGLANLAWGAGQSALGVVTAPFDRGRRIRRGARGVFYSVPELAFFNVRKGSFETNDEILAHLEAP